MAASDWGLNVNENWQYFNSRLGIALSFVFPMLVFKTGFEWHWLVFSLLIHRVHVFGHSLCLHTYFSHKAFKTGRFIQFLLGFIAVGSHLGSPFQYSFLHQQLHHPRADKEGDPHSPVHGYWHAFLGWRFKDYVTSSTGQQLFRLKDIYQYADPAYKKAPEIRFLSKYCFFIQNLSFPLFIFWEWRLRPIFLRCKLVPWPSLFILKFSPVRCLNLAFFRSMLWAMPNGMGIGTSRVMIILEIQI